MHESGGNCGRVERVGYAHGFLRIYSRPSGDVLTDCSIQWRLSARTANRVYLA